MHEMSLAQNLISQLHDLAKQHEMEKVIKIEVEVGPFSGVVVDSFEFGFNILAAEDDLTKDTKLEISQPVASFECMNCGHIHAQTKRPATCKKCETGAFIPKGSSDLTLLRVGME